MRIPNPLNWFTRDNKPQEQRSTDSDLVEAIVGGSVAGVAVTKSTAMQVAAVNACVKIISESVAMLPLHLYERLEDGGKQRAVYHPLYQILHVAPNPEISAFTFFETMQFHLLLRGNAYAEIQYNNAGQIIALWILPPDRVTPERQGGKLVYKIELANGGHTFLPSYRVLHIKGLSDNGLVGLDPLTHAKRSLGIALATDKFGAKYYENGTHVDRYLSTPNQLTDEGRKHLQESLKKHKGLDNANRLMLLEEGLKLEVIGINAEQAQLLQTRQYQRNEIAAIFRVPPYKLGDTGSISYASVEQQNLDFVQNSLLSWLRRWEAEINRKLLTAQDRERYYAEFLIEGLLRGDIATRYQAYSVGRQWGWLSVDDIRERENMNPLPDGKGQIYLSPLNMISTEEFLAGGEDGGAGTENDPEAASVARQRVSACGGDCRHVRKPLEASYEERARIEARKRASQPRIKARQRYRRLFQNGAARIVKRETADVLAQVRKLYGSRSTETEFKQWLKDYYFNRLPDFMRQVMYPILATYAEEIAEAAAAEVNARGDNVDLEKLVESYLAAYIARHSARSRGQIEALMKSESPLEAIEQRFAEWDESRADKVADEETTRVEGFIATSVFAAVGVSLIRWVASGDECPICAELDGQVVGVQKPFIEKGGGINVPDSDTSDFSASGDVTAPPLHRGCACSIIPEG